MGVAGPRTQTKFNLPTELNDRLSKAVPSGQRSRFVADAIEKALKEEAKQRALEQLQTIRRYPTNGESSMDVLRGLREARRFGGTGISEP